MKSAGVLSKYFNSVWCSYPNLEFDSGDSKINNPENPFEQCLVRRPFIQQLRIFCLEQDNNLTRKLDRWLCMSVEKNVSSIVLGTNSDWFSLGGYYSIPQQVFVARTLKVLDIYDCTLEEDRVVPTELPRLEKLSLSDCRFVGDNLLQKILCAIPKIKHITISRCTGLGNSLSVSCIPLIKYFSLLCRYDEFERIKIDAPSLHTLSYESCTAVCAIDFTTCTNLKELHLNRGVQYMQFRGRRLDKEYKIYSPSLKRLAINDLRDFPGVEIDAPNLSSLEFSLTHNLSSEFNFGSWSIPKTDDVNMTFSAKGFEEACTAGLEEFVLKLHNYQEAKWVIFDPNDENFILIEELQAVSFSSLKNFARKSSSISLLILLRAETSMLCRLLEDYFILQTTISLMCSSSQFAESFYKKLGYCSTVKYNYHHELVSPGEAKQLASPPWRSFMESNSSRGINHNAAIILHRRGPDGSVDYWTN